MRRTTVLPGTPDLVPRAGEPPIHRLTVPDPHSIPFVIADFDSFGPGAQADFPHRHTFHEIIYIRGGTGVHVLDMTSYELRPPNLSVVLPGQLHQWQDLNGLNGVLILFTEDFLIYHPGDRDLLRGMSNQPWLAPRGHGHSAIAGIIGELEYEYRFGAPGGESVLRALLHVLITRLARAAGSPVAGPTSYTKDVADEFTVLTTRPDLALWTVQDYARRIGVTAKHLTTAVRAATGRTPAEIIREARTREATRLLLSTTLTVRQIAGRIGFADPAYFCRFFRRETGLTPGDFRKRGDRIPETP